jgi:hypothetical protein
MTREIQVILVEISDSGDQTSIQTKRSPLEDIQNHAQNDSDLVQSGDGGDHFRNLSEPVIEESIKDIDDTH